LGCTFIRDRFFGVSVERESMMNSFPFEREMPGMLALSPLAPRTRAAFAQAFVGVQLDGVAIGEFANVAHSVYPAFLDRFLFGARPTLGLFFRGESVGHMKITVAQDPNFKWHVAILKSQLTGTHYVIVRGGPEHCIGL